jgi:hypothetical protein
MHLVSVGAENAGEGLRGRFTRQAHDVGVGSAGGDSGTCVRGILYSSARTRSVKTGSSEASPAQPDRGGSKPIISRIFCRALWKVTLLSSVT